MPVNIVFALASALCWGGGDFTGGMGVRSVGGSLRGALRVVLLSHATSLAVLFVTIATLQLHPPHGTPLIWGIASGVAGGLSITAFYIALSRGTMGAAAAVSGLLAAAIPAAVSLATEGSPGPSRIIGFLIAGAAIWMIAGGEATTPQSRSGMGLAIGAGAGFGLYFVALKMAGAVGPVWAMASARIGSLTTCALLLLLVQVSQSPTAITIGRNTTRWALLTALFDTAGNMLFVAATRAGRLDVAAVLASLYPASTILLAACMLRERPTKRQGWGMVIAATAVVLITL